MIWYKKVLAENKKEIVSSTIFAAIFALMFLLWHFALGKSFEWETISPVSVPPLWYSLYSALVFVTFGWFLYWIKFYQFLYSLFVETLGDWRSYKAIKGIIWISLILIIYYLVKVVVDLLNATLSFFYNTLNLLLYLSPPLGVSLIVFLIGYGFFKRTKLKKGVRIIHS